MEKLLAYQRAYDAAWQQQFPGLPVLLDENQTHDSLSATLRGLNPAQASIGNPQTNRLLRSQTASPSRLAVFVEENCPACETTIQKLQAEGQTFDLYMVGSQSENDRIRAWARQSGIQPDKVRAGHITLNHDSGRWQALGLSGGLPAIVREVNGTWRRQ
ncbi:TIGR03759 family integrating conjugative element protein [Neopusillimonas aromaticivorans]|uniref:TIGR03759 family integrating conjugative element protein n=1 Tax=Neopusillimonas aromaticivorans TaxID=2979868 RepID=UPI0025914E65|nr:TIGR03759 family integrating conjugative element protein [Neopusillimonas aromaticivorans]WJJ93311.1 TIGR03759 family integrating conjugative element protein [Neopusillimonas aromaticivorans]